MLPLPRVTLAAQETFFHDSRTAASVMEATVIPRSNFQIPTLLLISNVRPKREGGAFNNEAKNLLIRCFVVHFSYFCQRAGYAQRFALQLARRAGDSRRQRSGKFSHGSYPMRRCRVCKHADSESTACFRAVPQ